MSPLQNYYYSLDLHISIPILYEFSATDNVITHAYTKNVFLGMESWPVAENSLSSSKVTFRYSYSL